MDRNPPGIGRKKGGGRGVMVGENEREKREGGETEREREGGGVIASAVCKPNLKWFRQLSP